MKKLMNLLFFVAISSFALMQQDVSAGTPGFIHRGAYGEHRSSAKKHDGLGNKAKRKGDESYAKFAQAKTDEEKERLSAEAQKHWSEANQHFKKAAGYHEAAFDRIETAGSNYKKDWNGKDRKEKITHDLSSSLLNASDMENRAKQLKDGNF